MLNPAWLDAMAEAFWGAAGGAPPAFPRGLEPAILYATPLAIVSLPRLRPRAVDAWLARHGAAPVLDEGDGRLHACLVVAAGSGLVFLDGADPPDQRRFSLAHELAHYLLDYLRPRARALEALGPGIGAVLDGRRPPALPERVHAALAGVPLGVHRHLLAYDDPAVAGQERAADRLAVELLAPAAAAVPLARAVGRAPYAARLAAVARTLAADFGLPAAVAEGYAARLLRHLGAEPSFAEWLGLPGSGPSGGPGR